MWKCPVCETNNDDQQRTCPVCGRGQNPSIILNYDEPAPAANQPREEVIHSDSSDLWKKDRHSRTKLIIIIAIAAVLVAAIAGIAGWYFARPSEPLELHVNVDNADKLNGVWYINKAAHVSWYSNGDDARYNVELVAPGGSTVLYYENTTMSEMDITSENIVPGDSYALNVTAIDGKNEAIQRILITAPTAEPTEEPTPEPTPEPTEEPTPEPTEEPTVEPTLEPTEEPTEEPTPEPTPKVTAEPQIGSIEIPVPAGEAYSFNIEVLLDGTPRKSIEDTEFFSIPVTMTLIRHIGSEYYAATHGSIYMLKGNEAGCELYFTLGNCEGLHEIDMQNAIEVMLQNAVGDIQPGYQFTNAEIGGQTDSRLSTGTSSTIYKRYNAGEVEDLEFLTVSYYENGTKKTIYFALGEPDTEPTPAISAPRITVAGYAAYENGVYHVGESGVDVSWNIEENYTYLVSLNAQVLFNDVYSKPFICLTLTQDMLSAVEPQLFYVSMYDQDGNMVADASIPLIATETTPHDTVIEFKDENLADAIRRALCISGDITYKELKQLTVLDASDCGISSLDGIEYCKNLTRLNLGYNKITDISALAELTSLTFLDIGANELTDISAVSSLTNLTDLYLGANKIADISPVSALTSLNYIDLGANKIADLSPLASVTTLTELSLSGNEIADISPLTNLTSLTSLRLDHNKFSDVSPLAGLTSLKELFIDKKDISNLDSISHLDCEINPD